MLGPTAILNHALKHEQFALTNIHEEGTRLGFWGKSPAYEEVVRVASGKLFLNFDDEGYGEGICRFLAERFPTQSVYEKWIWTMGRGNIREGRTRETRRGTRP